MQLRQRQRIATPGQLIPRNKKIQIYVVSILDWIAFNSFLWLAVPVIQRVGYDFLALNSSPVVRDSGILTASFSFHDAKHDLQFEAK